MFVDACAMVSILSAEPDADAYAQALERASAPTTSALAAWEAIVVLSRADKLAKPLPAVERLVCEWLSENRILLQGPLVSEREILRLAVEALSTASGGANRLNALDCFHYAYAKAGDATLLTNDRQLRATGIAAAP